MKIRMILVCILMSMFASGCETIRNSSRKSDCEHSIKAYNRMVRWGEADKAVQVFAHTDIHKQSEAVIDKNKAKAVQLADYRVLTMDCNGATGKGSAVVEFDYYLMTNFRLKTLTNRQSWVFRPEAPEVPEAWLVTSELPEFR